MNGRENRIKRFKYSGLKMTLATIYVFTSVIPIVYFGTNGNWEIAGLFFLALLGVYFFTPKTGPQILLENVVRKMNEYDLSYLEQPVNGFVVTITPGSRCEHRVLVKFDEKQKQNQKAFFVISKEINMDESIKRFLAESKMSFEEYFIDNMEPVVLMAIEKEREKNEDEIKANIKKLKSMA